MGIEELNGSVPTASIIGMVFSLVIAFGIPIFLFIFAVKSNLGRPKNVVVGAVTFIISALILERIFHAIVLSVTGNTLTYNLLLSAIYGGLAAGLFEETGRYIAMKFFMKKSLTKGNSILYGIGHGGIESIIIMGLTGTSNIATVVMINTGTIASSLTGLTEDMQNQVVSQLSLFFTTPSYMFYLGGIERISSIALHICLSYIVYRAVKDKSIMKYIQAVLIHSVVDASMVLVAKKIPEYWIEVILLVIVAILALIVYRKYMAETD